MPAVGDQKEKFGRQYMFVNPSVGAGPGTWRVSIPEAINGGGGGNGGGSGTISADLPITALTALNHTTVAMDITKLPRETDL